MQFLGFLIFLVIAGGAFFTVLSISVILPSAFVPKNTDEEDDQAKEEVSV